MGRDRQARPSPKRFGVSHLNRDRRALAWSNTDIIHKFSVKWPSRLPLRCCSPRGRASPIFTCRSSSRSCARATGSRRLRADVMAGLTVAIVALPLSMAIAIASGTTPERGLFTAIVGGFLISALGGSRFQIGGPAGAFIVLVAAAVDRHGIDGVVLATVMAGVFSDGGGLPAARHLHQVHSLSGDGRIHRRHRRHHLRQPDQATCSASRSRARNPARSSPSSRRWRRPLGTISPAAVALSLLTDRPDRRRAGSWQAALAGHADRRRRCGRSRPGLRACRSRPSAPASAAFPRSCRRRSCRPSRWRRSRPCCPMPWPSPCWAPSNRCCRRWWPTA